MNLAVIYARYSDSKQTEQSIEGQLKVCHKYAEDNGYTVIEEYIDRAQTGRTDDRYQFQKMLKDSKKGHFDTVIVYAINRFGRNVRQSLNNAYSLEKEGVLVLSATEHFENSPSGRMFRTMVMAYDQYHSEELNQKVVRGMTINAEKCLSNGGTTPLGYKIVDRRYVIDEEKAPIVREIYTKYADGWSIKDICDGLNERHIETARGGQFNKSSLQTMLKNRKYLGIYIYNDIEVVGGIPRIVDDELFKRVQDKMKVNKIAPARTRAKAEYLLTTKLFCGYCKSMLIGHSSNQISTKGVIYNYYKCKNSGGKKPCKKKMVMKDYIEDIVVKECKALLTPKNISRIAKEVVKITANMDDTSELKRLEGLLKIAYVEKDNQMTSMRKCANDIVREMIIEDLSKIAANIKELERQIEIEKSRHFVITEKEIVDRLTALANGDINNIVYRKTLIKLFVNKIFLYDDKFTITFNTGDEEVTVTDKLLEKIEKPTRSRTDKSLCLSNAVGHQNTCRFRQVFSFAIFLCFAALMQNASVLHQGVLNFISLLVSAQGAFVHGAGQNLLRFAQKRAACGGAVSPSAKHFAPPASTHSPLSSKSDGTGKHSRKRMFAISRRHETSGRKKIAVN